MHCLRGVILDVPWRESQGETQRECQNGWSPDGDRTVRSNEHKVGVLPTLMTLGVLSINVCCSCSLQNVISSLSSMYI